MLEMSILPLNPHKMVIFSHKFCIIGQNFPTRRTFLDRLKFRGYCSSLPPFATTPLLLILIVNVFRWSLSAALLYATIFGNVTTIFQQINYLYLTLLYLTTVLHAVSDRYTGYHLPADVLDHRQIPRDAVERT